MDNQENKFNLNPEPFEFFKKTTRHEAAEDVVINGYLLKLSHTGADMQKALEEEGKPLISKEDLIQKKLRGH
jgi:hypothetical protein